MQHIYEGGFLHSSFIWALAALGRAAAQSEAFLRACATAPLQCLGVQEDIENTSSFFLIIY